MSKVKNYTFGISRLPNGQHEARATCLAEDAEGGWKAQEYSCRGDTNDSVLERLSVWREGLENNSEIVVDGLDE